MELELSRLDSPCSVETLYLGGGTPTQLSTGQLAELLELARRWFPPLEGVRAECTVEANPCDVTPGLVNLLAEKGVTRLSLGVQSFNDSKLKMLERDHTAEEACRAVELAREAGIEPAIDLIFAAPRETLEDWLADLDAALQLRPQHVSTYGLTYEKGTSFWSRRRHGDLSELGDELQRTMYEAAIDRLEQAGLEHYEVSNFACPGKRSRHNEAYWTGRSWHAAGPGAARYVDGVRETNHRSTTTWLKRLETGESPVAEREALTPEQRARERLVFGLRRLEGVPREVFLEETGYDLDQLGGRELRSFVEEGMLADEGKVVRLTREGLLLSDALWPALL